MELINTIDQFEVSDRAQEYQLISENFKQTTNRIPHPKPNFLSIVIDKILKNFQKDFEVFGTAE